MKTPFVRCLATCFLLGLATVAAAQPAGSISGVVVAAREDSTGRDQLLLRLPATLNGEPIDAAVIGLGKKLATSALAERLPDDWRSTAEKGSLRLEGAPLGETGGLVRIGLTDALPGKVEIELFSSGRSLGKKKYPIDRYPALDQAPPTENAPKLPAGAAPGDTIQFTLTDPAWLEASRTWLAGKWSVGGVEAEPVPKAGGSSDSSGSETGTETELVADEVKYEVTIGTDYAYGTKLDLTYGTDWGESIKLGTTVGLNYDLKTDLQPSGPILNDCTDMVFAGRTICLCGWFPEAVRGNTIYLDGKPLGTATGSSSTTLTVRIPDYITPGRHTLTIEGVSGDTDVVVVELGGEVDQDQLLRGQSTPIRLFIRGTYESIRIQLRNTTPGIISLVGGEQQVITTSGGNENSWTGTVNAVSPGDFNLVYELELGDCPCAEDGIQEYADTVTHENLYEETFASYRRGRELANDSQHGEHEGLQTSHDVARQALTELARTRERLRAGQQAWEAGDEGGVGPSSGRSFERLIEEAETQARKVLEEPETPGFVPEDADDDPRDTPAPTIYGEEIDPPWIRITDGWMEPTQGVWQDDDHFDDKPTKQLTRTGPATWTAELGMVANRPTLIFGIKPDRRNRIKMEGRTTYSNLVRVRHRLLLISSAGSRVLWTQAEAENQIRLAGPAGPEVDWRTSLMASEGLPKGTPFRIPAGPYTLVMELIREDGSPTGLQMTVSGRSVTTSLPPLNFAPAMLSDRVGDSDIALIEKARELRTEVKEKLELYYPLPIGAARTGVRPLQDMRSAAPGNLRRLRDWVLADNSAGRAATDALIARMVQRFGTDSQLGSGGKTFVILSEADFDLARHPTAAAFAPSEKVMIGQLSNYPQTVLHELVHTLRYLWSSDEMLAECGRNYHNSADTGLGNGVEIDPSGYRRLRTSVDAVMGPSSPIGWMTQCTYWHLLGVLQAGVDPDLLVLRAYLAKRGEEYDGEFAPAFQKRGVADLEPGGEAVADWAFVLRDSAGRRLATYPFRAVWRVPDTDEDRTIVPITYSVEQLPGTARIELVGPQGVADTLVLSNNPPSVEILTPGPGARIVPSGGTVPVSWRGTDPDGDELTYLVFYSPDNGATWRTIADEQTATTLDIPVEGTPAGPRIRVVVSDGVRSSLAEVPFSLQP